MVDPCRCLGTESPVDSAVGARTSGVWTASSSFFRAEALPESADGVLPRNVGTEFPASFGADHFG